MLVSADLLDALRLEVVNLLHLLVLQLLHLLFHLFQGVGEQRAALARLLERLVVPRAGLPHALAPALRGLLDAPSQLLGALHLDAQQQLELVVVGALRLLVEVGARLHGRHDGLDVGLFVDEQRDGAPGARDDLRELAQRKRRGRGVVAGVGLDGHWQGAELVWVEAPAVEHVLDLGLEVRVAFGKGRLDRVEIERVKAIVATGGGSIALAFVRGGGRR